MATSAFKSTTKRTPIGNKSNCDESSSSAKAHRRSRSLSRFSHRLLEPDADFRDVPAPRGKFVNTTRGSGFPEISLDDLAIEFFPIKSSSDEVGSDRGRLSRRNSEVSPATARTLASQRRGRSVSRQNAGASEGKSGVYDKSNDATLRRRRSVSVARYQSSDYESDIDQAQISSNLPNMKSIGGQNNQTSSVKKPISDRRLGRSRSQKDLLRSHDDYSSHSSAVTDDETKDAHYGKTEGEKTIRAVYAQRKAEHPVGEDMSGELYQVMRKELRYAVEEIRTELEQAMMKGNSTFASSDGLELRKADAIQAVSAITKNYATKLEQSDKRKQDLLAEIMLEEQRGKELSKIVKELLPQSNSSNTIIQKPLRARKRSNDKNRMSQQLNEEAEKYFEDFISNVEDTDISSIDGERSDASSSLGGTSKQRDVTPHSADRIIEGYQGRVAYNSRPVEMDGVRLPWLQWETSSDSSLARNTKTPLPVTPKTLLWDAAQDSTSMQASTCHSSSSHGSWNPGTCEHLIDNREDGVSNSKEVESFQSSRFDMDHYLELQRNEESMFETWKERNRISSGRLLLCSSHF